MLRLAVIVIGLAVPMIGHADGKVVRVERARTSPLVIPVLCVQLQADGSGLCIGPQPKAGESVIMVDETQVIAEIKVDGATKAMPNCDSVWSITGSVVRGDPSAGNRNKSFGLIDANVSRTAARMLPKNKLTKQMPPDARVEVGIDRDGDGVADVLAAEASCPNQGGECIEFWTRRPKGLERVWSANLRICR